MRTFLLGLWFFATIPAAVAAPAPQVPFTRHLLGNGMTVLFHEDHTVPLVAVDIMYKVGSRDEKEGRTGFAHLFEHLMFMGTERVPRGQFDAWMEAEGAWNNAWTSEDRTNYYEVGPAHTLPLLLWLEADRLQALGGQIDKEKLDLQRDVVRNERRQTSEDTPYGMVDIRMPELLWPKGHPYHHSVIGSHEDLQAASVQDVRDFFATWYVPNNAVLVVAGDFEPEATLAQVRQLFEPLASPAAPPAREPAVADPGGATATREEMRDDVELDRVVMCWRSPPTLTDEDAGMDLLAYLLAGTEASRLHQSLVEQQQIAQDVYALQWSAELGSTFYVHATVRQGVDVARVEQALEKEIEALRQNPPSDDDLRRARLSLRTATIAELESVADRATLLATWESFKGDAALAATNLERYDRIDAARARDLARLWLDPQRRVTLVVRAEEKNP